jgi:transcriptional regulator with XRE-family HTH domain
MPRKKKIPPVTTFAGKLYELRNALGVSKYELAKRSGIHWQLIHKYETLGVIPNILSAFALADALDVDVNELRPEVEP